MAEDAPDPLGIECARRSGIENDNVADAHGRARDVDLRAGPSGRSEDAAPVRIGSVNGRFYEVRRRDRPGGTLSVVVGGSAPHHDLEDTRDTFAVGDDLSCERFAEPAERPLESCKVFALDFDPR